MFPEAITKCMPVAHPLNNFKHSRGLLTVGGSEGHMRQHYLFYYFTFKKF
jgi:hypothetical protein